MTALGHGGGQQGMGKGHWGRGVARAWGRGTGAGGSPGHGEGALRLGESPGEGGWSKGVEQGGARE